MGVLCIFCDEFQAVGPAGTCDHCEPMPGAPSDQRAPEPEGKPAPSIVYRIVHVPTGRVYVGKHKLPEDWADPFEDDGYQGSGDHLAAAIDVHGWAEFHKDVLAVLPTEEAALELEAGLVGPEQVASRQYFNLCEGGRGVVGLAEEVRARLSAANSVAQRKRYADPVKRERHAAALRRPEARRRNSDAAQRRFAKLSSEERRALVARALEASATPEGRARSAQAGREYLARLSDEEHRERVARSLLSPEVRAKAVETNRTPESRELKRVQGIARMAAMTPEERKALMASANEVSHTPEVRALAAESNRARCAELTPEEKRAMTVAALAGITPDAVAKRVATRKRRYANMTTEERAELTARQQAGLTPESRRLAWAYATDEERAARVEKTHQARRRAIQERRQRGEPAVKPATDETRATIRAAQKQRYSNMTPDERAEIGRRAACAWANVTPEERAARGRAISKAKRRARAERERVKREVGMIFLALVAAAAR